MRSRQRAKLTAGAGLATMLIGALMVWAPAGAGADEHEEVVTVDKVTVCHRTNAVTNPYRIIEVAVDGSDGSLGNGQNDHTQHTGDPFDYENPDKYEPPFDGDDWGDIIPPYQWGPNPEDYFPGYNWDETKTLEEQCRGAQVGSSSITVDKTNNANGTMPFGDSEQASAEGAQVPFQVVISNTGDTDLTLDELTDNWSGLGSPIDLLTFAGFSCTRGGGAVTLTSGDSIPAGSVTTCTFTLTGYAPAAGGSKTNTVALTTDEEVNDDDTSTVTTPIPEIPVIVPTPPTFTLDVEKLNDASGDGVFSDGENAVAEGDDVTFRVTIRNTGTGALTLSSLTDSFDGDVVDLLSGDVDLDCGAVTLAVGSVLAPGSTTTCTFVLEDYAPAGGEDRVNTISVDTDQTTPSTDESTVSTPLVLPEEEEPTPTTQPAPPSTVPPTTAKPEQVLGVQVVRELPRTGSGTRDLAGLGAALIGLGAALVVASRRREDFAS